jgi:hypothetical protein
LTTNTLSEGDSGKRGFPVVALETAQAVKVRGIVNGESAGFMRPTGNHAQAQDFDGFRYGVGRLTGFLA